MPFGRTYVRNHYRRQAVFREICCGSGDSPMIFVDDFCMCILKTGKKLICFLYNG